MNWGKAKQLTQILTLILKCLEYDIEIDAGNSPFIPKSFLKAEYGMICSHYGDTVKDLDNISPTQKRTT